MAVTSGDHCISRTDYIYINEDQDTVSHLHDPLFCCKVFQKVKTINSNLILDSNQDLITEAKELLI
jgi:hypothetical protein